ncbi:MAG: RagB/SusD family nutrient uptake outer membrane protein [Ginsengibacter sp.]
MKNIFVSSLLLMALLSLSACNKYLDIKPKGYVIPETVEEFERILNGESLTKLLSDGIERMSDDFYDPTIIKDENILWRDYRLYMWLPDAYTTVEDYRGYSYWDILYRRVYQYNAVINGIDNATGGTAKRKAIAKARARTGRALIYYYIVNIYSKPYQVESAKTDLGIPLVTGVSIEEALPGRGTVQQTYDFISKEITEALPDLPVSSISSFEITKGGGYGYLARAYLQMGEYAKAAEAADHALYYNDRLVDYNNEYQMSGDRFSLKSTSILLTAITHPENTLIHFFDYTRGMARKNMPNETAQLFDEKDLRRVNVLIENIGGEQINTYMASTLYDYSIGITTPEMYLIRAEGNAREGKIQLAMDDLNKLRKNRIKSDSYIDLTSNDKIDATRKILEERRRELLFKGVRWFDMRRLHNDPNYGFTPRHYLADGTYIELKANSPRWVMTIPDPAVSDKIVQNP